MKENRACNLWDLLSIPICAFLRISQEEREKEEEKIFEETMVKNFLYLMKYMNTHI